DLSGSDDTVSDIYEYLVAQFATVLASDMGQYYTPKEISNVMARILTSGREEEESFSIYDPTVGSGSLLLTTASYMKNSHKRGMIKYFGQEKDAT
ncbi:type I restriction-modification system subunit M, partial [Enterococcus faecalis]